MPALRERPDDIPELLTHYLALAARELGVEPKALTAQARSRLAAFALARQCAATRERGAPLTVTAPGREIRDEDIPSDLGGEGAEPATGGGLVQGTRGVGRAPSRA